MKKVGSARASIFCGLSGYQEGGVGGGDKVGEGVLKVGVVSSSVTVEQLRQCWTVLGGVEHKHQCAQIAGIFNVWLLKVFSDI